MKAMILCAGLGSRLRPWTENHPKALVPVGGVPMLKRVVDSLAGQGFDELTLNIHHFADQIVTYIKEGGLGGMTPNISDESEALLDTGGGLLKARRFLANDDRAFLVHNVDILSNADLRKVMETHLSSGSDVTLLVSDRKSERKLVFGRDMRLKGWINTKTRAMRPASLILESTDLALSFSGIYVMNPDVFGMMDKGGFQGKFPIMDFFLSGMPGLKITGVKQAGLELIDIGKPDTLYRANLEIQ